MTSNELRDAVLRRADRTGATEQSFITPAEVDAFVAASWARAEQWVVLDAVRACRMKEEADTGEIEREMAGLVGAVSSCDLRDHFAMAALTGLLAGGGWPQKSGATEAYAFADAMLAERRKG